MIEEETALRALVDVLLAYAQDYRDGVDAFQGMPSPQWLSAEKCAGKAEAYEDAANKLKAILEEYL